MRRSILGCLVLLLALAGGTAQAVPTSDAPIEVGSPVMVYPNLNPQAAIDDGHPEQALPWSCNVGGTSAPGVNDSLGKAIVFAGYVACAAVVDDVFVGVQVHRFTGSITNPWDHVGGCNSNDIYLLGPSPMPAEACAGFTETLPLVPNLYRVTVTGYVDLGSYHTCPLGRDALCRPVATHFMVY